MRLYHRGAAFRRGMRGIIRNMLEKRNIRDHRRRLLAAKYELRREPHKAFCRDPNPPSDMRDKHRYKLPKSPRNSPFARVRNRCIFTGRSRSVYKLFRIPRIVSRGLASRGSSMGIKKSSR
jgi:small subunit ribosomal protein S14